MKIIFDNYTYIFASGMEEFKQMYNLVLLHLRFANPSFEQGSKSEVQFFELYEINHQNLSFKLPKNIKKLMADLIKFGSVIESFENKRRETPQEYPHRRCHQNLNLQAHG